MRIDLTTLLDREVKKIEIADTISFDKQMLKKAGILNMDAVEIEGNLSIPFESVILSLMIKGKMTVPCSITLKPVKYPFSIEVEEELSLDKKEEYLTIVKNSIDILPIIWQNIVLEIPLQIVSEEYKNESMSGDGWEFVTDEEKETIDPRLEKLTELLKERSE